MEVQLDGDLVFKQSGGQNPKQTITITNNNAEAIAFKVKTTAPKQFSVKPNGGRLEPGEKCEVLIVLQLKEGATFDAKRRDKFLVQSIKLPNLKLDEQQMITKIAELWTQAEQVRKSVPDASHVDIIAEKKIRCVYQIDEVHRPRSTTVSDRASVTNFVDPEPVTAQPIAQSSPIEKNEKAERVEKVDLGKDKEISDLKERISILQAACDGYKTELERVNLLRQRRADTSVPPTTTTASTLSKQRPKPQGLSLNVVAILCVLSFLFGVWLL
ncbi:phosphatidylinositol-binding protein scs2 [Boothiomyces sp. JEL0866]|nr:phosphatidylinositol-binding protein scs2 [Boothiomyces sp. JEL0866]